MIKSDGCVLNAAWPFKRTPLGFVPFPADLLSPNFIVGGCTYINVLMMWRCNWPEFIDSLEKENCIYIHIFIYIVLYIHMCIYTYSVYRHICISIYMCIYICVYIHILIYVYMYSLYTCIYIYTNKCIYTYIYTCIQDCLRKLEYCDKVLYFL